MEKYTKEVGMTYFNIKENISIEDVSLGDLVYVKIWNPQHYGVRELEFLGRIEKVTKCYFWILEYIGPYLGPKFCPINNCNSDQVERRNNHPAKFTKQWSKKSIIDLWSVETEQKKETKTYYSSN